MSITRDYNIIVFICDACDADLDTGEEDFDGALGRMREAGWVSRKEPNPYHGPPEVWQHYCDECK